MALSIMIIPNENNLNINEAKIVNPLKYTSLP